MTQQKKFHGQLQETITFKTNLFAPCGMNCGICLAYLRDKNKCYGCNQNSKNKAAYCSKCIIKNCQLLKENNLKYCFQCEKYPCKRLKDLDKRYRTKYGMSMIENLNNIKINGIRKHIVQESLKWKCPSCFKTICVHRDICLNCMQPIQRN